MSRTDTSLLLLALLALTLFACSDPRTTDNSPIQAHPSEWMEVGDPNFHGSTVAQRSPATCRSCHGEDLMGDREAPSCWECHDGPGGHPEGWRYPASGEDFHGTEVAQEGNGSCAQCHGEDYRGGWSQVSCYTCHGMGPSGHPSGWLDANSRFFHGVEVEQEGPTVCQPCHGDDYMGGTSGVSCYNSCHAGPGGHPAGWMDDESPDFHGTEVIDNGTTDCQRCHGDDLEGGTSGRACSECH